MYPQSGQKIQHCVAKAVGTAVQVLLLAHLVAELVYHLLCLGRVGSELEMPNHYKVHRVFRAITFPDFHASCSFLAARNLLRASTTLPSAIGTPPLSKEFCLSTQHA